MSEDYVQIIATAEGLKSLGRTPRLATSQSFHYKLREHSTTLEFLAARPRWAGGGDSGQKGRDPLFQRLRDFGTDSIFMRELQRDRGRYYTLAPIAMAFILMTPILVMTGYSPFVGISVLFVIGISSNQALTLNSLAAWLRRAGLLGGSAIWLSQRMRDVLLFPPLVFIEMWGVIDSFRRGSRYPFIFSMSGGVRMEDYAATVARTMVKDDRVNRLIRWMVLIGVLGTAVNVFSILKLDLINVLMLYPTLIFTLGLTFGALVYQRQRGPGRSPLGVLRWGPKVLGVVVGATVVAAFALGTGAAREPTGSLVGRPLPVPSHLLLLLLCGMTVYAAFDPLSSRRPSIGGRQVVAADVSGSRVRPGDRAGSRHGLARLVRDRRLRLPWPAGPCVAARALQLDSLRHGLPLRPPSRRRVPSRERSATISSWSYFLLGRRDGHCLNRIGRERARSRSRASRIRAAVGAVGFVRLVPLSALALVRVESRLQ